MKKTFFNLNYVLKILFFNKKIDKVCWMLGLGLFFLAILLYILDLSAIFTIISYSVSLEVYRSFLRLIVVLSFFSFLSGTNASIWLIFAFSDKKRLAKKRTFLKVVSLISLNFVGFYVIDYLIENFSNVEQTFSSVLLTNEHVLKKSNSVWQAFSILFSMFSMVLFSPMFVLVYWVLSESQYVYLEESDIRDRIGLSLQALFCLFPPFSIINLIVTAKNPLYISWLAENFQDQEIEEKLFFKKTYWSKGLNTVIWVFYVIMLLSFFLWFVILLVSIALPINFSILWSSFLLIWVWPLATLFLMYFDVYKKYLLEMDKKVPLWVLIFEILTLNIFMIIISLIFVYKANKETKVESLRWKTDLDKKFFWLILINTILSYTFIFATLTFLQISKYVEVDQKIIWSLGVVSIFTFLSLLLNLWKMSDYKNYFNNLWYWVAVDFLSGNFLGFIVDLIARKKKKELVDKLVWL